LLPALSKPPKASTGKGAQPAWTCHINYFIQDDCRALSQQVDVRCFVASECVVPQLYT
jgi:hypothetical protein